MFPNATLRVLSSEISILIIIKESNEDILISIWILLFNKDVYLMNKILIRYIYRCIQ